MRIFYSGARQLNASQPEMGKSLGGYISSSEVPNGRLNNIFSDLSYNSVYNDFTETKAIFLKNLLPRNVNNVVVYILYKENSQSDIKISAVLPIDGQIESIRSSKDLPYSAEFYDARVVFATSLFTIGSGNFLPNEVIRIENVTITLSSNPSKEEFLNKIIYGFSTDPVYKAVYKDETSFILQYRLKGSYTNTPEIDSTSNILTATDFGGGIDNSALIAETLATNDSLGIWLSKTNLNPVKKDIFTLFEEFQENNFQPLSTSASDLENIDIVIEYS